MTDSKPDDFVSLEQWCADYGGSLLADPKLLHYHTKPIQRELMDAGAMARVGRLVFLHKDRFWNVYQSIQVRRLEVNQ